MRTDLIRLAAEHPELAELDAGARRLALRTLLAGDPGGGRGHLVRELSDEIDGYGILTRHLESPEVTDVLVNGHDEIWVERAGHLEPVPERFASEDALYLFIDRLLARVGERVDVAKPLADARLPDGSRLHVAIPPAAPQGPLVSIRRLQPGWDLSDLQARQMMTTQQAQLLTSCVAERKTVLIAGGTGSGKTTLLNALLGCVPPSERVVLIEETAELAPRCAHVVSLLARGPNEEGHGTIDPSSLLRAALRMRPDRIVVGEVRGNEALVALAAMSTGHAGSLLTIHASSASGALVRLAMLAGQARPGGSEEALRASVAAAIDVTVFLERSRGRRRVAEIVAV